MKTTISLCAVLAMAMAMTAMPSPGFGQEAARLIDIPAQPLAAALTELSNETGLQVTAPAALVDGQRGAAVSGELTPLQALSQLLQGTGLAVEDLGADGVVIVARAEGRSDEGPLVLAPIVVGALTDRIAGSETGFSVLGARPVLDTPYSVSSYTDDLIKNTEARSITDVLLRHPSVGQEVSGAGFQDGLSIRGFDLDFRGYLYDGVPGLDRRDGTFDLQNISRVEVFRGANSFTSGVSLFGSNGGTVNRVPKRPVYESITELSAGFETNGSPFGSFDVSRRFGGDDQFGIRLNGFAQRDANFSGIDDFERDDATLAAYVEWAPFDDLTIGAEVTRYIDKADGYRDNIFLADGVSVPDVPDHGRNYSQPWATIQDNGTRYYGNIEYFIADDWRFFAGGGAVIGDSDNGFVSAFGLLTDEAGNLSVSGSRVERNKTNFYGALTSLDGEFDIGPVTNRLNLSASYTQDDEEFTGFTGLTPRPVNIFSGENISEPVFDTNQGVFVENVTTIRALSGLYEAKFFAERLSLLGGLRGVDVDIHDSRFSGYNESEVSPFGAVTFKPTPNSAVYVSYSEALERGQTAPLTAVNAGEALPPAVTTQVEVGAKYEFGGALFSVAAFEIERPAFGLSGSNVFEEIGSQINRGIELNVEGEPLNGLRLIGGVTFMDAEVESENAATDGNRPAGVPEFAAAVYAEYDLPLLEGFTLAGAFRYEGDQFVNPQNLSNQQVDSYIKVDLGARYNFDVVETPVTASLFVDNVFDENYWNATNSGGLALSTPRTLTFSLTANF